MHVAPERTLEEREHLREEAQRLREQAALKLELAEWLEQEAAR